MFWLATFIGGELFDNLQLVLLPLDFVIVYCYY